MDYEKKYKDALERAKIWKEKSGMPKYKQGILDEIFPELKESKDERIRKAIKKALQVRCDGSRIISDEPVTLEEAIDWLEKQGEQKPTKNIVETWKDMRLEVYQQASGNRHEPNYSDDNTKMFSLNDIDEIIEKMIEQNPTDNDMKEALRTEYEKGRADAIAEMQKGLSEDDEEEFQIAIDTLVEAGQRDSAKWLKSLKERIGG